MKTLPHLKCYGLVLSLFFVFSVSFVASQENCENAIEIPFNEYSSCGSMAIKNVTLEGAIPSSDLPFPECGNYNDTINDIWYSITVPDNVTSLAFHAFNANLYVDGGNIVFHSPGLAIYRGTPNNLSLIDCFFDEGPTPYHHGEIKFEIIENLIPNETLYLRNWDKNNYEFSFYIAASVRTEFPEHNCNTPALFTEGGCNMLAPRGTIEPLDMCGWNTTDNTVYYSFSVDAEESQVVVIETNNTECLENMGGMSGDPSQLQLALYSWNGEDCTGIGGSSNTGNDSTYINCVSGTGIVSMTETLEPGMYLVAIDGYSMISGTSMCMFNTNLTISPQIICPEDTIVCNNSEPFLLSGGEPIGGTYSGTYVSDSYFNPLNALPGDYTIEYTQNSSSCNFIVSVINYLESFPEPEICLVTVNDSNKNYIYWEKPITNLIQNFNIYKEISNPDNYELIGTVDYDDVPAFTDNNSAPQTQSYRYKISALSVCNIESELSEFHQTILLNILEENGSWRLNWTPYIGADNFYVNILRGETPTEMLVIESLSSDSNEYTDENPPDGFVYYQIEVILPSPCIGSKNIQTIYSNIATNDDEFYLNINANANQDYLIYPNPVGNTFEIKSPLLPTNIKLFDMSGKLIKEINNYNGNKINIDYLSKGMYLIQIYNNKRIVTKKLIID